MRKIILLPFIIFLFFTTIFISCNKAVSPTGSTSFFKSKNLDNPTFTPVPDPSIGRDWLLANGASFPSRYGYGSVVFNNAMWVISGFNDPARIWNSLDGVSWSQVVSPTLPRKFWFQSVVLNNQIWILGGGVFTNSGIVCGVDASIWNSSDGANWSMITSSAPYGPRDLSASVVFNDKLWVIGGQVGGSCSTLANDVWSSADGINWQLETANAGFSPRAGHTAFVFDYKIWVIGGVAITGGGNDVWSSVDGVNWNLATTTAAFPPRAYHSSLVFNSKMWVIAGNDSASDVWSSVDGINWVQATSSAAFAPRKWFQSLDFNNKMWVLGGDNFAGDVWYSPGNSNIPTPTATSTPTPNITVTFTATSLNTATVTETSSVSLTPSGSSTPTATFTETFSPTPTFTTANTLTLTPTATEIFTNTPTITPTKTFTQTPTPTFNCANCDAEYVQTLQTLISPAALGALFSFSVEAACDTCVAIPNPLSCTGCLIGVTVELGHILFSTTELMDAAIDCDNCLSAHNCDDTFLSFL